MQRFQVWFFVIKHQPVFAAQLVHYFEEKVRDQRLHSFSAFIANSIVTKSKRPQHAFIQKMKTVQYLIALHCNTSMYIVQSIKETGG